MDLRAEAAKDWIPIRFFQDGESGFVDWMFFGSDRFVEPFYSDTIRLRLRNPFSLLFRHTTPIEHLEEILPEVETVPPRGFIFHVSRCGSTLVTQMLSSLDKNIVISEAPILDAIIQATVPDEQKISWLQLVGRALGRKRYAVEQDLFIKFDSWSVLDLHLIEQAFPNVPWIFMYRDPVEVIVSNLRMPGIQMIPAVNEKIFPQMDLSEILRLSTEERFARTIASFFRVAVHNIRSPRRKFIDYIQLPEAVGGAISHHFGIEFTDADANRMMSASRFHAKSPAVEFVADGKQKREDASEDVVRFARELVTPLYEELKKAS